MIHAVFKTFGRDTMAFAEQARSLQEAWDICDRPDWMLWVLKRTLNRKEDFVRLAVDFAEAALPVFEALHPTERRPRDSVQVAKDWLIDPVSTTRESISLAAGGAEKSITGELLDAAAEMAKAASASAMYAAEAVNSESPENSVLEAFSYARYAASFNACGLIRSRIPAVPKNVDDVWGREP
jgi:hypothetical protein